MRAKRVGLELFVTGLILIAFSPGVATAQPMTGAGDRQLRAFDRVMRTFVKENKIPGAALAVTKNGRLVYARGFGYADREKKEHVEPASLFRIASISKPITAVAILQLVEQGKLNLDSKFFDIVKLEPLLQPGQSIDPRLKGLTVRHLLHHTGGWKNKSVLKALNLSAPPTTTELMEKTIRYRISRPPDFDPGTTYAYSNFGYSLLGRVIEAVSGQSYDEYVQQHIFRTLKIRQMRLGRTLLEHRASNEVRYYDQRIRVVPAIIGPQFGKPVPLQYGGESIEVFDSFGGWLGSVVDLARFAVAFDRPSRCKVLREKSIRTMFARPKGPSGYKTDGKPKETYYACGWFVRPVGRKGKAHTFHRGGLPGTSTLLVRRADGINWVVFFNTDRCADGKAPAGKIDPVLHKTANSIKKWPRKKNLFRNRFRPKS